MTQRVGLIAAVTFLIIILATALVVSAQPVATSAPVAQTSQTAAAEAVPPPAIGDIRYIPCPMHLPEGEVDGETVLCGQVIVPENWDEPEGPTIDITYAILKARSGSPFADPIIYLEGGPGGSALEDIESLSAYFDKLRETRDFIYYDQRGTAYSGNLECPILVQQKSVQDAGKEAQEATASEGADTGTDDAGGQTEDQDAVDLDPAALPTPVPFLDRDPQEVLDEERNADNPAETGCAEYFEEQGVDLGEYTTANSVRDLVALMQALDYDVYNVYGISYGSRLGLELLRTYEESGDSADPPAIRSVVIDGISPPHIDNITQAPFSRMDITLRTLSECEADEACGAAYPDIRQRVVDLLAEVEASPLVIISSDGMTETVAVEGLRALLTGATTTYGEELELLGYAEVVPYLPRLVDELAQGVGDTYMGLKQGLLPPAPAPESGEALTLFDPLALRSQQLSDEAEALSHELAMLSTQAQRASDALASQEPLPEFFARELVQLASEQPSFHGLGPFGGILLLMLAAEEPNRATLAEIVDIFDLPDTARATLHGIANMMSDEEVAETIEIILSDRVVEQLTEALQREMNTAVLCNDMYSQFDIEGAFEAYRSAEAPQLLSEHEIETLVLYIARCERYGLISEAGESAKPVVSELPMLVANGGIDFTTPVEWGEAAAEHLPNAQLVTIPMYDHGATAKSECGQDIVRAFFTYPDQPVDDTCTEDLKPHFVLPDEDLGLETDEEALGAIPAEEAAGPDVSLLLVQDSGANSHANGTYRAPQYTVAQGDTLYSIAHRFGLQPQAIARANGLSGKSIYAGQVLIIPGAGGGASNRPPTAGHYQRVQFSPGATDWSGTGVISNGQPKGYILGAAKGQTLEINTQSSGEPLKVILERADGRQVSLTGENDGTSNHLFTTLPATGDCIVIISPVTTPESPSLRFGITFIIL